MNISSVYDPGVLRTLLSAAQTLPRPAQEGGGRKGLPKSFLNRFTRVHVELLQRTDLLFIAGGWAHVPVGL